MSNVRSGTFAAWARAWLAGTVGSDDVLAAITANDPPHQVADAASVIQGLGDALLALRRDGGPVRLVLPVSGDLRGVAGPAGFRSAALEAGEAICGAMIAFVPEEIDFFPSSAPSTVRWRTFEIEQTAPDELAVADAQLDLTTAIRESTTALAAADVAGAADDVTTGLKRARRAGEHLNLPPNHPPRAVALLAQAERLAAVLELAGADVLGGAVDRFGMSAREASLRPLATAVRRARLAGYNAQ